MIGKELPIKISPEEESTAQYRRGENFSLNRKAGREGGREGQGEERDGEIRGKYIVSSK